MKKVAFIDRDGPINVDEGYVYKVEDWKWSSGVQEGLKLLQDAGFTLAVVTNQSAIAEGKYSIDDMKKLHAFMLEELEKAGVYIEMVAFCPHARNQDECDCRKPKVGMAKQIEKEIGPIDYASSWIIGDKEADMLFGKTAGTHTALLKSRYWEEGNLKDQPDLIVDSLLEAAQKIVHSEK